MTEKTTQEAAPVVINLTFSLEETNFILNAVGKEPYATVAGLIDKIKQQAIPQLPKPAEE